MSDLVFQAAPRSYLCCVPLDGEGDGSAPSLGSVYGGVATLLKKRGWRRLRATTKNPARADVVLGGPCAGGVPWKALRVARHGPARRPPLSNFYQAFERVCRKAMLARALRDGGGPDDAPHWLPRTFLVTPGRPELSERSALVKAHEARGGDGAALWILKPSDGGKGAGIKVFDAMKDIDAFLDGLRAGSIAFVACEYLRTPLLLTPGDRKFDVRVWVAVDADFRVHVWRRGVLRTCATPFTLDRDRLDDAHVHLSNHCIAATHEDFGAHESPTNEVFFPMFDAWLAKHRPGASVEADLAPQWRAIIAAVMRTAKDHMASLDDYEPFRSFQVFGFDFMVDDDLKVWLVEVNSSPAIAEDLADDFCAELTALCVDAYLDGGDPPKTDFVEVPLGDDADDDDAATAP